MPTAPMLVYNNLVYDIQSGAAFTQSLASCCKVRDSVRKEVHRTLIFLPVNLMKNYLVLLNFLIKLIFHLQLT